MFPDQQARREDDITLEHVRANVHTVLEAKEVPRDLCSQQPCLQEAGNQL